VTTAATFSSELHSTSTLSEEQRAFRNSVVQFLEKYVVDDYPSWRQNGVVPRSVYREAADHGFLGIYAPEEFGGGGASDSSYGVILVREAARLGCNGFAINLAMHANVCLPFLATHGSDEQKQRWMPQLVDGGRMATPVIASPTASPSIAAASGDLPESVENVLGAAQADVFFATSRGGHSTAVLETARDDVDGSDGHVDVTALEDLLGLTEAGIADVRIDRTTPIDSKVVVGERSLVGARDLWLAVAQLAAARSALEWTLLYVEQRKVFGTKLIDFDNTRARLTAMTQECFAGEALMTQSLTRCESGVLTDDESAAVRRLAVQIHSRSADLGLQLHGGYGYMKEYPIAQAYADAGFLAALDASEGALARRPAR
jgi:alkylation response protein AidB-like acyl-CoA dehydrogenase